MYRAKKVYETLGFKRGQSPKQALDIGLGRNIHLEFEFKNSTFGERGIEKYTDYIEIISGTLEENYNANIISAQILSIDPGFSLDESADLLSVIKAHVITKDDNYNIKNDLYQIEYKDGIFKYILLIDIYDEDQIPPGRIR